MVSTAQFNRAPFNRSSFSPVPADLSSAYSTYLSDTVISNQKVIHNEGTILHSSFTDLARSQVISNQKVLYLPSTIESNYKISYPYVNLVSSVTSQVRSALASSFNQARPRSTVWSRYTNLIDDTITSSLDISGSFLKLRSQYALLTPVVLDSSLKVSPPSSTLLSSYSYQIFPSVFYGKMELRSAEVIDLITVGVHPSKEVRRNGQVMITSPPASDLGVKLSYYTEEFNDILDLKSYIGEYQTLNLYKYRIPDCTITEFKYERVSPEYAQPLFHLELVFEQDNFLRAGQDLPTARVKFGTFELSYAEVSSQITVNQNTQRINLQDGQVGLLNAPITSKVFQLVCFTRDFTEVETLMGMKGVVHDLMVYGQTTKNCKITGFGYDMVNPYSDQILWKYTMQIEEDTLLRQMSLATLNQYSFGGTPFTFAQVSDFMDLGVQAVKESTALGASLVRGPGILGFIVKLDCYTRDYAEVLRFRSKIGSYGILHTPDMDIEDCQITDFKFQKLGQFVEDPVWNYQITVEQSSILQHIGKQDPPVIWNGVKLGFAELETEIDMQVDSNTTRNYVGDGGTSASRSELQSIPLICYTFSKTEINQLTDMLGQYGSLTLYGEAMPDKYIITEFRWKPYAPYGKDLLYMYTLVLTQDKLH